MNIMMVFAIFDLSIKLLYTPLISKQFFSPTVNDRPVGMSISSSFYVMLYLLYIMFVIAIILVLENYY